MSEAPPAVEWSAVDHVVFDMDGTLLDLYFDDLVWNELLPRKYAERQNLPHEEARARIRGAIEVTRGQLEFYCLDHWTECFGVDVHAVEEELSGHVKVRPGALDFLSWAEAQGLQRILATNAHPRSLRRKLELTGIGACFEHIVSSHDLGYPKEQRGFWHGLTAQCPLLPERTVFIDDNPAVLESARDFGIRYLFGIARPNSHNPEVTLENYRCLRAFNELSGSRSA